MFNECESLAYLPDISIWDESEYSRYTNRCISLSFALAIKILRRPKKISDCNKNSNCTKVSGVLSDIINNNIIKIYMLPLDCINCTNA